MVGPQCYRRIPREYIHQELAILQQEGVDAMTMFIEAFKVKSAEMIACNMLPSDPYHKAISKASRVMVDTGRGAWIYQTQWSSGKTVWRNPHVDETCTVSWEGEVSE
jgi:hypothetical protein